MLSRDKIFKLSAVQHDVVKKYQRNEEFMKAWKECRLLIEYIKNIAPIRTAKNATASESAKRKLSSDEDDSTATSGNTVEAHDKSQTSKVNKSPKVIIANAVGGKLGSLKRRLCTLTLPTDNDAAAILKKSSKAKKTTGAVVSEAVDGQSGARERRLCTLSTYNDAVAAREKSSKDNKSTKVIVADAVDGQSGARKRRLCTLSLSTNNDKIAVRKKSSKATINTEEIAADEVEERLGPRKRRLCTLSAYSGAVAVHGSKNRNQ